MSDALARSLASLTRRLTVRQESDAALLARYISAKDSAAFAELVRRHGPLVLGVCRRMLGHIHDAEDAFQATFLVLARSARSVRKPDALPAWLYGTAVRVCRKARMKRVASRPLSPRTVAENDPFAEAAWKEVRGLLDDEMGRLPAALRTPLILCYFNGLSRDEAAEKLGWSRRTLMRRLEQARERLRRRLARRGVAALGLGAFVLTPEGLTAGVSDQLAKAALDAGVGGIVPASVQALAGGGVAVKLLSLTAGLLLLTGGGIGLAALATRSASNEQAVLSSPPAPQERPKPGTDARPKLRADMNRPIRSLLGHKERVVSVAYSSDGRWIATAAWDGTARLWDAQTGKEVRRWDVPPAAKRLKPAPAGFSHILFSPDDEFIVATVGSPAEAAIVWNRRTGEKVREFPAGSVAFSPNGRLIACGGRDVNNTGIIRLYDFATAKMLRELRGHLTPVISLTFSADSKTLVSLGLTFEGLRAGDPGEEETKFTRVWDVATGKECRTVLEKLGFDVHTFTFSTDGRTLSTGEGRNGEGILLWEAATGGRRAELTGHTKGVWGIAFSPDGRTLASAGGGGTVRLWDLPSGKEVGRLEGHKGYVWAVAFSPDGRTLVSGGVDKTALLWDVSRITGRRREPAERSSADFEADWRDLAGDAATGYASLGRLVSSPGRAVAFLGKQLQSAKPPDAKRIERLIANLDDERFQVREKATKELEALAEHAAPALRKALTGKRSLEVRRRLGALLDRLDGAIPSAETVRQIRAVEALEFIGNPEARRLLDKLAAGPAETRLTEEAKAAVKRLRQSNR